MAPTTTPWIRPLDRGAATPIFRQIVALVRDAVADGRLAPGARIPSATDLARALHSSRPTVVRAFRELERAGVIVSQVGRGSFVAERGPGTDVGAATPPASPRQLGRLRRGHMTSLAQLMDATPPGTIDLRPGTPGADFADDLLPDLARRAAQEMAGRLGRYVFRGLPELIDEVAARLRADGHDVTADQVLITNGAQDGIALVARWAAQQARSAVCETPTFWGVPLALMGAGHWVTSVHRDASGLDPAGLESALAGRSSMVYTCSDFHHPTGSTLDAASRASIAQAASRHDTVVVVDEIFRDLRFAGSAPPSLYRVLPPGRRVLVGSLSKSFMAGLRVGWLVADRPLLEPLADLKRFSDLGGAPLMQAMATLVLRESYDRHLRERRKVYRERVRAAAAALRKHMPSGAAHEAPEGGFHLWVRLPAGCSSMTLYLEALTEGVAVSPGPLHDVDGGFLDCFRMSVAWADVDEIRRAIEILGRLVRRQAR